MARLLPADVLFCYDGSLEGFLSAVFECYARHTRPQAIAPRGCCQPALGQEVAELECDMAWAERVKVGLCNKAGHRAYDHVKKAFLAAEEGREVALLDYIVLAMELGRKVLYRPDDPVVARVEALSQRVANEQERILQFVRFEELENGVWFGTVNPCNAVLPLVMPHFVERFNIQPFIIYDETRHMAGVYDGTRHYLVSSDQLTLPERSQDEQQYQQLWKKFYDSLSHEQRYNPDLRRSHMPQRYWKNLTEMKLAV